MTNSYIYNDIKIRVRTDFSPVSSPDKISPTFIIITVEFENKQYSHKLTLTELCDHESSGKIRKRIAEDFARNLFADRIHDVLITALMKAAMAGKLTP